jgi:hypothetical protein
MPESQQPKDGIDVIFNGVLETPDVNVLDIGAGTGKWGKLLKGKVKSVDGVEVWTANIINHRLADHYDNIFSVNMLDFDYSKKKYDVMILGDVLEHLTYENALKFMKEAVKHVARIYLSIPISLCVQDGNRLGNPFESHLYQWTDEELQKLFNFKLLHTGFNPNGLVKIGTYILETEIV